VYEVHLSQNISPHLTEKGRNKRSRVESHNLELSRTMKNFSRWLEFENIIDDYEHCGQHSAFYLIFINLKQVMNFTCVLVYWIDGHHHLSRAG
jgi:hypothetical protein